MSSAGEERASAPWRWILAGVLAVAGALIGMRGCVARDESPRAPPAFVAVKMPPAPAPAERRTVEAVEPARPAEEPAVATTRRCSGRVVDERGDAVEGADVYALAADVELADAASLRAVQTRADGGFTLDIPSDAPRELVVTKSGFLPGTSPVAGGEQETVVRIEHGGSISGRVFDADGKGIPNAQVVAIGPFADFPSADPARRPGPRGARASAGVARTGPDGRYQITGLRRRSAHRVDAEKNGYYASYERNPAGGVTATPDAADVDFLMETATAYTLRVVDARTRDPIGGFELDCLGLNVNSLGSDQTHEHFSMIETDQECRARGEVTLGGRIPPSARTQPSHTLKVFVSAMGYRTSKVELSFDGTVNSSEPSIIALEPLVPSFGTVRLRFATPANSRSLDAWESIPLRLVADGKPFERLSVWIHEGATILDHVPAGPVRIELLEGDLRTSILDFGYDFAPVDVVVPTAGEIVADVKLEPAPGLACFRIAIGDETGQPVHGADVVVRYPHFTCGLQGPKREAAVQYFYVQPGAASVTAKKRGYETTTAGVTGSAGEVTDVRLTLRPSVDR